MYTLARLLQMAGLTIPLLAIVAQLNQAITAGKMLLFLVVSVLVFSIGYLLQRYTERRAAVSVALSPARPVSLAIL